MKSIFLKLILFGIIVITSYGCHENQTYYCYLVEKDWPDKDTLAVYDEAFWFYKKKSKPQDECALERANLIIENQWNPNYICDCDCGWKDD